MVLLYHRWYNHGTIVRTWQKTATSRLRFYRCLDHGSMPELITPTTILAELPTHTLPRTVVCQGSVSSTMDLARELLPRLDNAELPLLTIAEEQTAGRGRMGRRWEAPAGSALLLSLALRPTWLAPANGVALVWMTAVALCEAVEQTAKLQPTLKWPNDLLLPHAGGWAKAAGILLEVNLGVDSFNWAIIGCGVNVAAAPPHGSTAYPATSLNAATGAEVSRLELLRTLLVRLDHWYAQLRLGAQRPLFTAWRARLGTIGQRVRVATPNGTIEGFAEEVGEDGALLVRDEAGLLQRITAGDVGLIGA